VSPAKTAEPIEMPSGLRTWLDANGDGYDEDGVGSIAMQVQ